MPGIAQLLRAIEIDTKQWYEIDTKYLYDYRHLISLRRISHVYEPADFLQHTAFAGLPEPLDLSQSMKDTYQQQIDGTVAATITT